MKKLLTILVILPIFTLLLSTNTNAQPRNAVLEYVTGTWCQWCPCSHQYIENIKTNYPGTVVLAYHGAGTDPWQSYSAGIRSLFGFNAYPTGVVGRKTGIIGNSAWNNPVVIQSNTAANLKVTFSNKNYNSSTREFTITANVEALQDITGTYNINFVLTENNLVYPQTGNGSCPGNPSYVHHHVVKGMLNGDVGEMIHNTGTWTTGTVKSKTLIYTLPAGFVSTNCDINAFVYKVEGNISTQSWVENSKWDKIDAPTGIINIGSEVTGYTLNQNYPNPFNPSTNIHFSVPKDGNVSLKFYDVLGNEVATYHEGFMKAGVYNAEFNGNGLASGIYFYTLKADDFAETKKMVLSK